MTSVTPWKLTAAMGGQFVISQGIRDHFVSEDELRRQARRGLLQPGDRVYHPALSRWLYAREVAEIEDDLRHAAQRARPGSGAESLVLVPVNGAAVAGFLCAGLALVPLLGVVSAVLGLVLSARGLRQAAVLFGSGYRLALAGLWLSLLLLPTQVMVLRWILRGALLLLY